jgi:precorrin-6A/cobalt-precorrin-6A reductase
VILLFGGTSEAGPLAAALQGEGWPVLVSTATEAPLALPEGVRRRAGRLDAAGIAALAAREGAVALVDAGHPFALDLHSALAQAAVGAGLPLVRFERPAPAPPEHARLARDHVEAANIAFGFGGPVLLTTGSRTLAPYVLEARRRGLPLKARVLDHPESLAACATAGLRPEEFCVGRGPFTVEDTLALLRALGAAALVSKDSGEAGGLRAKAEAARLGNATLVLVSRPRPTTGAPTDLPTFLAALRAALGGHHAPR